MGRFIMVVFLILSIQKGLSNPADSIKYKLTVFTGIRTILCDSFAVTTNLDLANTIMDEYPAAYVGFGLDINWHHKFTTGLEWIVIDNYILNNFKLTAQYNATEFLGIRAGYLSFDYFLENDINYFLVNYHEFFTRTIENPFIYDDDNYYQNRIKEQSFILGPVFMLDKPKFSFNLKLNWGIARVDKYSFSFVAKELNTNKKQKITLETTKNQSSIFFPEFEMEYQFIQSNKLNLAFQIHGNIYYQDKNLNYEKRIYEWTHSNINKLLVYNPRHRFFKYEMGIGIIFAW